MRRGFSILELLIAACVGLVVLALLAGLVRCAELTFRRSEERADPRELATRALARIRRVLADVVGYTVSPDGHRLAFSQGAGDGSLEFDPATGRLVLRAAGQAREEVWSPVTDFRVFDLTSGLLRVHIHVERPPAPGVLQSLGPLTLADDILVSSVARAPVDTFWNANVPGEGSAADTSADADASAVADAGDGSASRVPDEESTGSYSVPEEPEETGDSDED